MGIYINCIINDIKSKNNYFKIDNNIKKEKSIIKNNNNAINSFHNNTTNNMNFKNVNVNFIIKNYINFYNNSSIFTLTRLKKEFELCQQDEDLRLFGFCFTLIDDNIFNWKVSLIGPKNTPYENGLFFISIEFPQNYPNFGPEFKFINKIYCLFVDTEINFGYIDISRLNEWRSCGKVTGFPFYTVKNALFDIFCCLCNLSCGLECPFDLNMRKQFKYDMRSFEEEARKWTKEYAHF